MQFIASKWGLLIRNACQYSSVPPEFIAALIANESAGKDDASRFEPSVCVHLRGLLDGKEDHFGPITKTDLAGCKDPDVRDFSTSWGLTQIMGYHLLVWGQDPRDLLEPKFNLEMCTRLLAGFAHAYQLDVRAEFEEMFRCWNTGRPNGITTDPEYVPNGLRRMAMYHGEGPEVAA